MKMVRGTVRVDGAPVRGADVLVVDEAGKVLASVKTDEQGAYRVAPPESFGGGGVLARVYRPIAGAALQPLDAGDDAVRSFDFSSEKAITLSGEIVYPAGVSPDWVEVAVTPRALDGIPTTLTKALIMEGTGPALLGTYRADAIKGNQFEVRIVPGTWDLVVARVVEDGPALTPPQPNLINARLTLPDGQQPAQIFGGYRLSLTSDTRVRIELEVMR